MGYIFTPFLGTYHQDSKTATLESSLTANDLGQLNLSVKENKIVKQCDSYSDSELIRRFLKKRPGKKGQAIDFIADMDQNKYEKVIRPFVDRRLNEVFNEIVLTGVPVFLKEGTETKKQVTRQLKVTGSDVRPAYYFTRSHEGITYQLRLKAEKEELDLKEGTLSIIALGPVILLKGEQFYRIESLTIKNLKPFFDKESVFIPKQFEKKYIQSFVKKVVRDGQPKMEGMTVRHQKEAVPAIKLHLTKNLEGNPAGALSFDYGGKQVFYSEAPKPVVVTHYTPQEVVFEKWERQMMKEKEPFELLARLGLKKDRNGFLVLAESEAASEPALIRWVNTHSQELEKFGIVTVEGDLEKDYYTGKITLDVSVADQRTDWFDVYMLIRLEDTTIPFTALKENLRSGAPEYELDDGRIFVIPEAWFTEYGDLVRFARKEDNQFKLSKQHVGLLPNQEKGETDSPSQGLQRLYDRSFDVVIPTPAGLNGTLRFYQRVGLTWLLRLQEYGLGGCLADDMGLGKTIQTIALLLKAKEGADSEIVSPKKSQIALFEEEIKQPSLLVMPTSLLYNWKNEIASFAPELKVLVYSGLRTELPQHFHLYDIILTSYGVMRIDVEILKKYQFHYLILDESQFVKNPHSKTYQALLELNADYRLALTGTPVENSLSDLWAQLHFLNRDLLGSFGFFQERFVIPIERDHNEERELRLKQLIHPFIMRRRKEEVVKELPDLTEQVYWCEMTEAQEEAYERYKSGIRNSLLDVFEEGIPRNEMRILEALLRMRQMANHPRLAEPGFDGDSGKFLEVIRSLESLLSEGHKVLLFSSFAGYLELFARFFDSRNWPYAMITGKTRNREDQVKMFQDDGKTKLFLISLKAGGTGLNLTAADYVFILDPWWNPAAENQALSRAHRIGQKNKVFVYRFITRKTIEEKIFGLQKRKQELADTFVNFNNPLKQLSEEELKKLFDFNP